jgi:hypothetical protein
LTELGLLAAAAKLEMTGAATITMDSAFVLLPVLLEIAIVKLLVPVVVGVPVTAPVLEFKERPAGSEPIDTLHVGPVQPVDVRVCEYAVPTPPVRNDVVVMEQPAEALTRIDRALVELPLLLDTAIVKLLVPVVVGVPVIAPVLELIESPAGKEPTDTVQVGLVQLLDAGVCE